MDFSKLNWSGDFMASELYGDHFESSDFICGIYYLKDFPEIEVVININEMKIHEVNLVEDFE